MDKNKELTLSNGDRLVTPDVAEVKKFNREIGDLTEKYGFAIVPEIVTTETPSEHFTRAVINIYKLIKNEKDNAKQSTEEETKGEEAQA